MFLETTDELAAALRPAVTRLARNLRRLASDDKLPSHSERSVLVLLEQHGSLLSSELAQMEKMTPQSMGQILKQLAALDLIDKTPDEHDKRKVYVSLSAVGKKMIQKVRKDRDEWMSKAIAAVCNKKEQEILMKAIEPLQKLIAFEY